MSVSRASCHWGWWPSAIVAVGRWQLETATRMSEVALSGAERLIRHQAAVLDQELLVAGRELAPLVDGQDRVPGSERAATVLHERAVRAVLDGGQAAAIGLDVVRRLHEVAVAALVRHPGVVDRVSAEEVAKLWSATVGDFRSCSPRAISRS